MPDVPERDGGHHHQHGHHHRSREYDWKEDAADHFLRQARFNADRRYPPIASRVAELVGEPRDSLAVMDLGCGPALLLPELARALPGARLIGMDPSASMLSLARRVLSEEPAADYVLLEGRAEDIPLEDGSLDVVVSLKNLHEWENAGKGLSEVARVLVPGGALLIQDSNRAYPYWRLRLRVLWLRLSKGPMAVRGLLGPYRDAYRPEEVDALLSGAGLEVVEADRTSVEYQYVARRP